MEEARLKLGLKLFQRESLDFFMIVFNATDRAQHWFWRYMDPSHPQYDPKEGKKYGHVVRQTYQMMDEFLSIFLDTLDDSTTLIIISDHGFGPSTNKVFYPNLWLHHLGLLNLNASAQANFSSFKPANTFVIITGVYPIRRNFSATSSCERASITPLTSLPVLSLAR